MLASAKLYRFDAALDGRPMRVAGIGAVFTAPAHRGRGARASSSSGCSSARPAKARRLALLFSKIGPDYYARLGFEPIATPDRQLRVIEATRRGAPMTMVRGGDDRDLKDIVAMGAPAPSATGFISSAIATSCSSRSRGSGCSPASAPAGVRDVHFFIAEEGASAVAYVVITVARSVDARGVGDRDPAGARVGAMLQALIAREPAEPRPAIIAGSRRIPAAANHDRRRAAVDGRHDDARAGRSFRTPGSGRRALLARRHVLQPLELHHGCSDDEFSFSSIDFVSASESEKRVAFVRMRSRNSGSKTRLD